MAVALFPARTRALPRFDVNLSRLLLALLSLLLLAGLLAPRPSEMQMAVAPAPVGYDEAQIRVEEAPVVPSNLPRTAPGLGPDEGLFLAVADPGSGATTSYFVAQGHRYAMSPAEVQAELQRNPLRYVRPATPAEADRYPLVAR